MHIHTTSYLSLIFQLALVASIFAAAFLFSKLCATVFDCNSFCLVRACSRLCSSIGYILLTTTYYLISTNTNQNPPKTYTLFYLNTIIKTISFYFLLFIISGLFIISISDFFFLVVQTCVVCFNIFNWLVVFISLLFLRDIEHGF